MISLFETLALDLNHRAINRLYSYLKKRWYKIQFRIKRKKSLHGFPCFKSWAEVIGFHSQEMGCGLIERIPCGNIFTAFLAIRKKISTKKAASKI